MQKNGWKKKRAFALTANTGTTTIGRRRSGDHTVYTDLSVNIYTTFFFRVARILFCIVEIILYYSEVDGKNSEIGMKLVIKLFRVKNSDYRLEPCSVFCAILWWWINQLGVVCYVLVVLCEYQAHPPLRNTNLSRLVSNFTLHFIRLNLKQITALTLTPFTLWMEHERLRHK